MPKENIKITIPKHSPAVPCPDCGWPIFPNQPCCIKCLINGPAEPPEQDPTQEQK